jgi:hypothetical protein
VPGCMGNDISVSMTLFLDIDANARALIRRLLNQHATPIITTTKAANAIPTIVPGVKANGVLLLMSPL